VSAFTGVDRFRHGEPFDPEKMAKLAGAIDDTVRQQSGRIKDLEALPKVHTIGAISAHPNAGNYRAGSMIVYSIQGTDYVAVVANGKLIQVA